MYCEECEKIQKFIYDETVFWISAPTGGAYLKLCTSLDKTEFKNEKSGTNTLSVRVSSDRVEGFLDVLQAALTPPELAGCTLVTTRKGPPGVEELGRMMKADHFINRYKSGWIVRSMEQSRYETWFQPIVHGKDWQKTYAHEGLFRMRNDEGEIVPPGLVFDLAEASDLLFSLDLAARKSAAEHAARAGLKEKIFINFNPTSIYDPSYCLRETAAAIGKLGLEPSDIVFEITETHRTDDISHLKKILDYYRNAGFGVALDDVGSGWSSLNLLHHVTPDYIKLDMELIQGVTENDMKQTIVSHLTKIATENGIKTICEGVETKEEADWVTQIGADYLQGFYFAKPALLA